ncbi:transcriptional repressor LexA [Granulosicoccus antarcticus]|uniref:LexA repressor n=1 Tax=Granulosicoccus antarcticus IMCC3135 TaxID=1192854 RepID=A0A2Z2NUX9_9GAMM|nr:transcriptional repressor LexA [Granulosicoccus antarcticus]ASJ75129.1 LexA repressor [Granulosicoccus antarcticus IMCC3135]
MEPTNPLTHLEARVLAAIERYIRAEGVAPTIAELAGNLRLKSKGTVHRYVQSLIAKGRLERHGNGWRGLRIVGLAMPDRPSNVQHLPINPSVGSLTHMVPESNVEGPMDLPEKRDDFTSGDFVIPLLGRIAAGQPIEAIEDANYLDLAAFFIGPDRYALRVTGESMMDVGILDGDTVILRKQDTAQTGDIVVALIDAQEATLKRLGETRNGIVELIPENSSMATMRYDASRVSFQGVLVGQLRSY